MKLKSNDKIGLLALGILSSWITLGIMLNGFYVHLREAIFVSVRGGTYQKTLFTPEELVATILCVFISSICFAIALGAKEKEISSGY